MKILNKIIFYYLLVLFAGLYTALALEVPDHPASHITDFTGTLTQSDISYLNRKLSNFEDRTSNQIAVLIIPSLEGDNLEDYSIRLAEKWKIGQRDKDNGVILLIVKNDRKLRIEVGYGLEAMLPDSRAGSIIRDNIAPDFKQGKFFAGINKAIDGIMVSIDPEIRSSKSRLKKRTKTSPAEKTVASGTVLFIVIVFAFLILGTFPAKPYSARRGYYYGGGGSSGGWSSGGGFSGGFSGGGGGFGGGGASGGW